ncbi:cellulose biosynthesis cyclic di-GMP-binding regulatory protein BcsB [Shigella flexneri]
MPVQSQLKVYLNDESMGVLPVTKEQLGKKTLAHLPINPLFITDFNRVRLQFVAIIRTCAKTRPAPRFGWTSGGAVGWIDLSDLTVKNDSSHFPVPFFDLRDNRTNTLPMVFAGRRMLGCNKPLPPSPAVWFAFGWRGQNFPVLITTSGL